MFWSPNVDTVDVLNGWWPGANYVDIVGMDCYPNPGATFASAYGAFYTGFANRYRKHFCIGETGVNDGGSVADKEAWVTQLANTNVSAIRAINLPLGSSLIKRLIFGLFKASRSPLSRRH